jgi:drug/metabolite transporter superfamily protein YnfA
VTPKLAIFAIAGLFEIAGCFAFYMWLRRGVTPLIALLGDGQPKVNGPRPATSSALPPRWLERL